MNIFRQERMKRMSSELRKDGQDSPIGGMNIFRQKKDEKDELGTEEGWAG